MAATANTRGQGTWPLDVQLRVQQEAGSYHPQMAITERALAVERAALPDVADPRGLRGSVRDEDLRGAVEALAGYYGMPAGDLRPTLLAGAPLTGSSPSSTVLVGVTLPSGATTVAFVVVWENSDSGSGYSSQVALTEVRPAGTALLDQVFAVPPPCRARSC